MRLEGQAQAGDWLVTPWGEYRYVVAVVSAGDLIEALTEQSIAFRSPNFMRNSIAGTCALFGSTANREKRDRERERKRLGKSPRVITGAA